MRTTNYIEGILFFTAFMLLLFPFHNLVAAREVPVSVVVALGSYGLLLIARRPRRYANETIKTRSGKTAWYLAMTGVVLGAFLAHMTNNDPSGFFASNAVYIACIYYGLALSMLIFSFISYPPVQKKEEHSHLPKHRFNTLELSI